MFHDRMLTEKSPFERMMEVRQTMCFFVHLLLFSTCS